MTEGNIKDKKTGTVFVSQWSETVSSSVVLTQSRLRCLRFSEEKQSVSCAPLNWNGFE